MTCILSNCPHMDCTTHCHQGHITVSFYHGMLLSAAPMGLVVLHNHPPGHVLRNCPPRACFCTFAPMGMSLYNSPHGHSTTHGPTGMLLHRYPHGPVTAQPPPWAYTAQSPPQACFHTLSPHGHVSIHLAPMGMFPCAYPPQACFHTLSPHGHVSIHLAPMGMFVYT